MSDIKQAQGRQVHTREAVLNHRLRTTHNDPLRHWLGIHGAASPDAEQRRRAEAEAVLADQGQYVDVHAWTFTPATFLAAIEGLKQSGLTGLGVLKVHETKAGELEFYAVLEKV